MLRAELEAALKAARGASEAILDHYSRGATVRYKTPIEPVTEADTVADELIREELTNAFPDDGWLSEESVDAPDRLTRQRVWIVDPLDGTREFVARRPEFTVSIGLAVAGRPVLGVVQNPVTRECFYAVAGEGAFRSVAGGTPERLQVSRVPELRACRFAVSRSETLRGLLTPYETVLQLRALGGMAMKLALVATGAVDGTFTLQTRCEWDIAAGIVLVEEAGGEITRPDGSAYTLNQPSPVVRGVVATNGQMHGGLLAALKR